MFKLLTLFILVLSFNTQASDESMDQTWHTEGLTDAETQIIDESSDKQLSKLTDCMQDNDSYAISETSCINEVFGDIYN